MYKSWDGGCSPAAWLSKPSEYTDERIVVDEWHDSRRESHPCMCETLQPVMIHPSEAGFLSWAEERRLDQNIETKEAKVVRQYWVYDLAFNTAEHAWYFQKFEVSMSSKLIHCFAMPQFQWMLKRSKSTNSAVSAVLYKGRKDGSATNLHDTDRLWKHTEQVTYMGCVLWSVNNMKVP